MSGAPQGGLEAIARFLVVVLGGVVLVGSAWQVATTTQGRVPSLFVTLALLTRLGSAGLGMALAIRTDLEGELRALAIGLVAIAGGVMLAGFSMTAPSESAALVGLAMGFANGLLILGGFGMSRFLVMFPIPLSRRDLERAENGHADVGLPGLRSVKLGKASGIATVIALVQHARAWQWAMAVSTTAAAILAIPSLIPATRAAAVGIGATVLLVVVSLLLVGTPLAVLLPALTLHRCDDEQRRRLLWLMAGLVAALHAFLLGGLLLTGYVVSIAVGRELPLLFLASISLSPLPFLLFLLALLGAALLGGVFDARLTLRRTMVVSSLGVCGLFLFALVESALSDAVLGRIGAPAGMGSWVAAGSVAVAFRPVQQWLDRRLRRLFPAESVDVRPGAL